ncbi:MAG: hypothetical protein MUF19_03405 [Candidatus Pacebacteria bacterium]|jgi:predicted acylesterase/phospholipase RssA|nr:hypothetical protein [Candidatus Paceibacterota bacterium]
MVAISAADFLSALKLKSSLDERSGVRPWVIGGGGAFNGAYLAGVQWALAERGLHLALSGVVGVSTSIPALGYLLSALPGVRDEHRYHTTTYSVEGRSRGFVKWYGKTDARWLRAVFEGSTGKPINYERVASSGVRFVGVVTDWETGQPYYIEPTNREEFFTLIEAGCSMPGLAPPVLLRNRLMCDSVTGDPCPVPWLMEALPEEERPTHILFVTNAWHKPPSRGRQLREWQLSRLLFGRTVPRHIIDQFALRHRRFYRGIEAAKQRSDVAVAVEWLPWQQRSLDRNPKRIEALTLAGYERFRALLQ